MTPDERIQELERRVKELEERQDPFRPTTLWPITIPHVAVRETIYPWQLVW